MGVWQAEKIVRKRIDSPRIIGAARTEDVLAIHIEIELLVEFLVSNIAAKFKAVLADNLAVVVVELKGVAGLRQLAFKVVSKKTDRATQCDIGYALKFRSESRVNSATKARADQRIRVDCRSVGSSGRVNHRRVIASAQVKRSPDIDAAISHDCACTRRS